MKIDWQNPEPYWKHRRYSNEQSGGFALGCLALLGIAAMIMVLL